MCLAPLSWHWKCWNALSSSLGLQLHHTHLSLHAHLVFSRLCICITVLLIWTVIISDAHPTHLQHDMSNKLCNPSIQYVVIFCWDTHSAISQGPGRYYHSPGPPLLPLFIQGLYFPYLLATPLQLKNLFLLFIFLSWIQPSSLHGNKVFYRKWQGSKNIHLSEACKMTGREVRSFT